MVRSRARGVHADGTDPPRYQSFPQAPFSRSTLFPSPSPKLQSWPISCAQTAIMPTKSEIDAKAAASSTKIRNITDLPIQNIERTLFLFLFLLQGLDQR